MIPLRERRLRVLRELQRLLWEPGARRRVEPTPERVEQGLLRRVGVSVSGGQAWDERYRDSLEKLDFEGVE